MTTETDLDLDLLVSLVAYIDRDHDYRTGDCHPRPPDDCETWCAACSALRPVRDDILRAARQINEEYR